MILSARGQLATLSAAMVLGMSPWFAASVVSGALAGAWHAPEAVQPWLTMSVQLGFVAGTLLSAAFMLSDRWSPRHLAAASALIAALATAALTLPGVGTNAGLALRTLTGAALAGVYPPGMKIAAGWWQERRGLAIGVVVGALTLGSAFPNLLRATVPAESWRPVLLAAAASALLAALLFLALVREGPYQARSQPFSLGGIRTIVSSRGVRLATAGYLGHMWELYAMWSVMTPFWTFVAAERALPATAAPLLAFATIAAGLAGSVAAGLAADRWGRAVVTIVAMAVSGTCCLVIGLLVHAALPLLVLVALAWGVTIVADSAQFSALVTEQAPSEYIGTALTLQTSLGFLLTMVTIRLLPVWAANVGWERAFMPLAIGPALGILAMRGLVRVRPKP